MPPLPLTDSHHRRVTYLRASVTDRCNQRCLHCMPEEGVPARPREEILTYEELLRLARVFASLGVSKIRITGGEPLLRHDLIPFLAQLAQIDGVSLLALSTNASLLAPNAEALARAGVRRLNISLDTLDRATFVAMRRRDALGQTLEGIEAVRGQPFARIKLNSVIIAGVNDGEIAALADFALARGLEIRFIELMPTRGQTAWSRERVVPADRMREALARRWSDLAPAEEPGGDRGPSRVWTYAGGQGRVGFISALSESFCQDCNRMRLTSDGSLRGCLFGDARISLRDAIRAGESDAEVARLIGEAVRAKPLSHRIGECGFAAADLGMSQVGG